MPGRASQILPRTMPNLLPGKTQPGCPASNLVPTFWAPCTSSISPLGVSIPTKMSHVLGEEVMRPSRSAGRKVSGSSLPSFPNDTEVGFVCGCSRGENSSSG